ncbi:MAG: hypothetical protein IPO90_01485 [Flavobacteriales bacterium]|nr:hypothetical protein [Flavobacteriales bacterium]
MTDQHTYGPDFKWRIDADHGPGPVLEDRNVVPLKPSCFNDFDCPVCGTPKPEVRKSLFIGIQVLGEYRCAKCASVYLRDLPVGFQTDLQLAFEEKTKKILHPNAEPWITYPEYTTPTSFDFPIERKVFSEHKRVIVLNLLDHLYGHVLLKLYNAQHYLDNYKDQGLVLLIPKMFEWLAPKGVAELWVVDQKLSQARAWHPCIDQFVQKQLVRYDEVQLARAWGHPDFADIDFERFSGIPPFSLTEYTSRPPHITFVARTDRLWFASPWGKFCYRALGSIGLKKNLGQWFIRRQSMMIASSMRQIKEEIPSATFTVVGLAPPGGLSHLAEDLRTTRMNNEVEIQWCRAYAKSQIVVGVHGSNMLLPSAHAAGLIEILPADRFGNIAQDVSIRYRNRMQLFLYRFVDEFARPQTIAQHAISMLKHFTPYYRNNQVNTFGTANQP